MTRPTGAAISGNGSTPPASRVGVALVRDRLAAELERAAQTTTLPEAVDMDAVDALALRLMVPR